MTTLFTTVCKMQFYSNPKRSAEIVNCNRPTIWPQRLKFGFLTWHLIELVQLVVAGNWLRLLNFTSVFLWLFQGKFKGQNWMMELGGSLRSVSAKVVVAVEVVEVAATTLVDFFSSPLCCSWITWRSSRKTCLLEGIVLETVQAMGWCSNDLQSH